MLVKRRVRVNEPRARWRRLRRDRHGWLRNWADLGGARAHNRRIWSSAQRDLNCAADRYRNATIRRLPAHLADVGAVDHATYHRCGETGDRASLSRYLDGMADQ